MIRQRMIVPTVQPKVAPITAPPGQHTKINVRYALSQHVIEPELLGAYPRWVKARGSDFTNITLDLPLWFCFLFAFGCIGALLSSPWMLTLSFVSVLALALSRRIADRPCKNQLRDILKYGKAKPGVVKQVTRRDKETEVAYVYEDENGRLKSGTALVPANSREPQVLRPGMTFTVLQSAEDDTVIPYFAFHEFMAVPVDATSISRQVSTTLALQHVNAVPQPRLQLAPIEPELLLATPRPVRLTRFNRRVMIWLTAGLALLVNLFFLLPGDLGDHLLQFGTFIFGQIMLFGLINAMASRRDGRKVLRDWHPTTAVATNIAIKEPSKQADANPTMTVSYVFETTKGRTISKQAMVPRKRIWQLNLQIGSCFTVLYDPACPPDQLPYFQIQDAEVIGATGAKITT